MLKKFSTGVKRELMLPLKFQSSTYFFHSFTGALSMLSITIENQAVQKIADIAERWGVF